ncbi:MAG: DUF4440 domain-containing protein [Bryobacteraceae bacterium]|nr:DUF4440 domain-containing protein [Bryobacteraceae bacterium]
MFWHLMLAVTLSAAEFEHSTDIGAIEHKGRMAYDGATRTYRISGSGANMWGTADAFHFAYRQVSGDVTLTADIDWAGSGGNAHRKGGPVLRAGLDADDVYADAISHGDGLVSFQYRKVKGGPTSEVKTTVRAPVTLRIARHGEVVSVEVAPKGGPFQPVGALTIPLPETLYAGLAVCSHDAKVMETALFSSVSLHSEKVAARAVESTLEIMDVETGQRRIVRRAVEHFEAPNWTGDGRHLYYNGGGKIYRIPVRGGQPEHVYTGGVRVNNDHGLAPDGRSMVVSGRIGSGQSQIFQLPIAGGEPRQVTRLEPSYWHGWSPDGGTLAYCAARNGNYDIYTIPVSGGEERRLTDAAGLDDGPEYSPDGGYIYFNSERSGLMRIWRMKADGSEQTMISQGAESADWFAHPSPDGKWIAYISYDKGVKGHPANKDVVLQLAAADGSAPKVIATLFGGQGTMNVPSWSPDSRQIAFVSYRLVASPEAAVRALLDKQVADWNRGDVRAFMDTYENSENVTFIGKAITRGHAKVLAGYHERYPSKEQMGTTKFDIEEVRMLGPGHAYVLGRFSLTRAEQHGGNTQGIFTLLLRRDADGWKIIVDHTS